LRPGLELGAGIKHSLCCSFDSGLRFMDGGYSLICL
jgi:hypothetical protein